MLPGSVSCPRCLRLPSSLMVRCGTSSSVARFLHRTRRPVARKAREARKAMVVYEGVHQVARLVDEGTAAVALFVEQPLAEVSRAPGYGGEPVAHAPHVIAGHSRDPKAQFPCLGHLSSAFLR